jgi:hypothetical protein
MGKNDFTEVYSRRQHSMRKVPIPPKEEREKAAARERRKPKGVEVNFDELDAESADGNSPRTEEPTQPSAKIPRIQLPQDDRLDSQFAAELGEIFSLKNVFRLAGCAVKVSTQAVTGQDNLEVLTAFTSEELVTWAEYHCVPFKFNVRQQLILRSMPVEVAAKILASEQFLSRLRPIKGLDCVNLPIIRETGKLELLCVGYDAQSQTLTLPNSIRYNQELTVDEAIKFLRELLQEFPFHPEDKDRALSVTIAMILTLFCRHLFEPGTMRPGFLFSANQTGSGKSLLAKLGLVPMLGCAPTGVAPVDEEEMRKRITTTVLTGQTALFFDNFRTKLASAALEALMTSTIWEDRLLGSNKQIKAHHGLTVLLTANDANLSPDMMRRVFAIEMFNQYTDNAERKIKH